MAEVLDTLVSQEVYTPFVRVPEPEIEYAATLGRVGIPMPRGMLTYAYDDVAISSKLAADTQALVCSESLPKDFAWMFLGFTLSIRQDVAHDYTNRFFLTVSRGVQGGPDFNVDWPGALEDVYQAAGPLPRSIATLQRSSRDWPRALVYQTQGDLSPPGWSATIYNNNTTNAGAAGTVRGQCQWLQFDLNEAFNASLHALWPRTSG